MKRDSPLQEPNYYIITGGPGAGKTTLLQELAGRGFTCIEEVARGIIKEQQSTNGQAVHQVNGILY